LATLMDELWGALTNLDILVTPQGVNQPGRAISLGRLVVGHCKDDGRNDGCSRLNQVLPSIKITVVDH
jgi:hypothetical protein